MTKNLSRDEELFQEARDLWEKSKGNSSTKIWLELAEKTGDSVEGLRSWFKRERQKRGIEKKSMRTMQQKIRLGYFDLETLPLKISGHLWAIRDQYIPHTMIDDSWRMLGWAGKYLDGSKIYSDIMTPKEAVNRDSLRVTESARAFIDTCDIVIWHNGDEFDGKILNSEILYYKLPPLKYRTIDTLKLIRANFKLPSYKLDYVNDYFGITSKIKNEGQGLWDKCLVGDKKALKEMLYYNQGDIFSGEDLYRRIQPYCNGVPNFATYDDDLSQPTCNCGGKLVKDKNHPYWYNNLSKFERLVCSECGSIHRGRKTLLTKNQKQNLVVKM